MAGPEIRTLFEPRSIAVIGASRHSEKIGFRIFHNILAGGYRGQVYPVNPQGGEIGGLPAWRRIDEIPGPVDVACIVIPAERVYEAVEGCARKEVQHLAIISSGFSEVGNEEEERKIVSYARAHSMRVLGPNIFGFYSAQASLNATFASSPILPGRVAIITQSGALGIAMIGKTAVENIGLSAVVSMGNKTDLDEADLLEYLATQERTRAILIYAEGVREGERLLKALRTVTRRIPVVVIKAGRSERGARAAASHTGSLAGSDEIFGALMRQVGALRAETIEEAFHWCKFLSQTRLPAGENTVIITNGGGIGVMATDASEKFGVKLADDTAALQEVFAPVTPPFGSTKNPVDLTGQATSAHYRAALETALKDRTIHSVIALYGETAVFDAENLCLLLEESNLRYQAAKKPLVFSIFGGEMTEACLLDLRRRNVAVFGDVYEAVSCLGSLYAYRQYRQHEPGEVAAVAVDAAAVGRVVMRARLEGRAFLLADEGQELMRAAGVPVPRSAIAHNLEEAVRQAEEIGYPVAMKVVSPDILHKSDAGGVALDLEKADEVVDAYQAILRNVRAHPAGARIEGMEIAEMVQPGVETIIGARRDPIFGPLVMFGLGGIYVEVLKDVSFRALPLTRREVTDLIKEIRGYPLLLGVRGEEKKDVDALSETILKVSALLQSCPELADVEINPLVIYARGQGVRAVDVRVLFNAEKREG
ncbi:MAG: acetate--CoA ligase family protein [Deltaproteobacteria bacterium]|nr:acetate--CoA ligase family protein [Deltaproteobacteria bacterium]